MELASIEVEISIAASNAGVIGEALRSAKIDIVGGENDFFEKVVRAVGMGKSWTVWSPTAAPSPT